jgi:hypothetical protein
MLFPRVNIRKSNLFVITILSFFFSCNEYDTGKSAYIGVFEVDINRSSLESYSSNVTKYSSLTLAINQDETFAFNSEVPFIKASKGRWKIKTIDGIDFLYLVYGNGPYGIIEDEVNLTSEGDIYINNTRPQSGQPNVKTLFFTRRE